MRIKNHTPESCNTFVDTLQIIDAKSIFLYAFWANGCIMRIVRRNCHIMPGTSGRQKGLRGFPVKLLIQYCADPGVLGNGMTSRILLMEVAN